MARYGLSLVSAAVVSAGLLSGACGGGEKKTEVPAPVVDEEDADSSEDNIMIPEEKFDEIKSTFERKATTVARCFPDAVDAGEVDKTDRIKVTVGVEIQKDGSAKDLHILGTSKRSKTLESCVLTAISRWEFTTLPKPVIYSYGFVLQRL